jgi:hypothetical protein
VKRVLTLRPSPALIVACIALFASLGGVSYGLATGFVDSREIRNNTVRTQDLRNNDIRAIDIRNSTIRSRDVALNTLTGSDINEEKLTEVPTAAKAKDAETLGGSGAAAFVRRDSSGFVAVPPAGDWEVVPGETVPGYFVDPLGFVHLQGALRRSTGASELALTLPGPARPEAIKRMPVYAENAGSGVAAAGIRVNPNGEVLVNAPSDAAENLISLEGVTYRADG